MYQNDMTGEGVNHRALQDRLGVSFPRGNPPAGWSPVDATPTPPTLDDLKARKRRDIVSARKAAEAQGVTVNGVRYAGDADTRRDMKEALDYCTMTGVVAFTAWKDADGGYHLNHPVSDVRNALMSIATRRGALIAREGELLAQIDHPDTTEQDLDAITWE